VSDCEVRPAGPAKPVCSAEEARVRVGTALAVIEVAAQILHELPPVDVAFRLGDRTLYRYLQAAETASCWLVGQEAGDSVERPGPSSAFGDGQRIYEWSEEETERHFQSALNDWRDRQ
jgi:hypothetical protein